MLQVNRAPGRTRLELLSTVLLCLSIGACSRDCGSGVWGDYPNMSVSEAVTYASLEDGPPLASRDLQAGSGRSVAQLGRQLRVRVTTVDSQSAELSFLYPAVDRSRHGTAGGFIDSGEVPRYFGGAIAGMRVGGVREITLPRTTRDADALRSFRDIEASTPLLQLPSDRELKLQVELLDVCKPKVCKVTTWSIPSSRNVRLRKSGCG